MTIGRHMGAQPAASSACLFALRSAGGGDAVTGILITIDGAVTSECVPSRISGLRHPAKFRKPLHVMGSQCRIFELFDIAVGSAARPDGSPRIFASKGQIAGDRREEPRGTQGREPEDLPRDHHAGEEVLMLVIDICPHALLNERRHPRKKRMRHRPCSAIRQHEPGRVGR